jgi:cobalt-zinc-cadmium efflux system outer membrane protein
MDCSRLLKAGVGVWLFVSFGATFHVGAEPATNAPPILAPDHLSLAKARQLAFERNWDLLAAKTGIDSATAQLIVAKEFPNPNVSLSTTKIDPNGNATPLGNSFWDRSYDTIFAVTQLIEIAGKRGDRQTSARAGIVGSRARLFDARRTLDQGVTKAYIAALLANENERILTDSAGSLRHEADIAKVRLKAGDISESDERQIENNADVFELQAKSARASAVQARVTVEVLMGLRSPKGNWTPEDSLETLSLSPGAPPELQASAAARPDVLAAEADVRKAESDLKLQRALRIPDPTFLLQYERQPPGPPGPNTWGIGVSFPLPLWNLNRGNIKSAQAALDQSAIALDKARAQVIADISNADVGYREAFERWQRYQSQIRPRAAKVREAVAYAYEKGGASLVDLLTAERDDNSVRLATAQAMSDTASAAADLTAARNVLPENELTSRK